MGRRSGGAARARVRDLGDSPRPPDRQHALRLGRVDRQPMGYPDDGRCAAVLWNQRFLLRGCLNVIQLIGWTAVMLIICGGAADAISKFYGFSNPTLWIILAGVITTVWAFVGHTALEVVAAHFRVCAASSVCGHDHVVFQQYGWKMLSGIPREKGFPFMIGMDLVIAMPISWLPLVSDYSRFATDSKSSFWGTWIGYFIISSWMYLVGLAACLATRSADPSGVVMELMLKFGWAVPALIIVLFSTFTTTFLDIYSTAISGLNIVPTLGERKGWSSEELLGTATALVFPTILDYEHFLLFIGAMFCPLFGVVLADYFLLRRGILQTEDLYREGGAVLVYPGC